MYSCLVLVKKKEKELLRVRGNDTIAPRGDSVQLLFSQTAINPLAATRSQKPHQGPHPCFDSMILSLYKLSGASPTLLSLSLSLSHTHTNHGEIG